MEDEGVLEVDFFLLFETSIFLRKIQGVEHVQDKGVFKGSDIFLHSYVGSDVCFVGDTPPAYRGCELAEYTSEGLFYGHFGNVPAGQIPYEGLDIELVYAAVNFVFGEKIVDGPWNSTGEKIPVKEPVQFGLVKQEHAL